MSDEIDVNHAKWSFATRTVPLEAVADLSRERRAPKVGDLALLRVSRLGQHRRLEGRDGRKQALQVGDLLVGVYGNRYATDQFEAFVPDQKPRKVDLVGGSGLIGKVRSRHSRMRRPTDLRWVGYLVDRSGATLNLGNFIAAPDPAQRLSARTIAVVGSSMNAGKTTAVARIVAGLARAGARVAAAKVTGTACGRDLWTMQDAGAALVLDFTSSGLPSTAGCSEEQLVGNYLRLRGLLAAAAPEVAVLEIADGLFQRETAMLLESDAFQDSVDGVVMAAGDPLSAEAGVRMLRRLGYNVLAVSGLVSASPLAVAEVEAVTLLPCLSREQLQNGRFLEILRQTQLLAA